MKMNLFIAFLFGSWLVLATMATRIFREPIEARLTGEARSALDSAGLQMVDVNFDHLDATLSGNVGSRDLKVLAAETVDGLDGARVTNNHITFGEARTPMLTLSAGDPIRVEGLVDRADRLAEFGEGFDVSRVEIVDTAVPQWNGLAPLAAEFFGSVRDGQMEFDGRTVLLAGQADTELAKRGILDQAVAIGENFDIVDRLTVAEPEPFEISIAPNQSSGDLAISGRVDDERLREVFASLASDDDEFVASPRVVSPPWLYQVPGAARRMFELGIAPSLRASADGLTVSATFPDEFWRDAAERSLRQQLPADLKIELDFKVARKAVAEADPPEEDPKTNEHLLPIKIEIADNFVRLSGTVRTMDERALIVERATGARNGVEVLNELRYDYKQPRIPGIRAVLPDAIVYAIGCIDDYGAIDLDTDVWRVNANSRDSQRLLEAGGWLKRLEHLGVGIEAELRIIESPEPYGLLVAFEQNQIYFKADSAQISKLQSSKVEALAEAIISSGSDNLVGVIGLDQGQLGLQRARAVRRALVKAGVPLERVDIRAEVPRRPIDWRSERAYLILATDEVQSATQ